MMSSLFKTLIFPAILLLVCPSLLPAQVKALEPGSRQEPWDPAVVDLFRKIPVQDGGRIKPLDTVVSFLLLRLNGRRSIRIKEPQEETLSPMEWALDCLFHPKQAADYKVFQIQTAAVLDVIELSHEGKRRRDRYSYNELLPGVRLLFERTKKYRAIKSKERTHVQNQVIDLASSFSEYDLFCEVLSFARLDFTVGESKRLQQAFPGQTQVKFSQLLGKAKELLKTHNDLRERKGEPEVDAELSAIGVMLGHTQTLSQRSGFLSWIPPLSAKDENKDDNKDEKWMSLNDLILDEVFSPTGRDHTVSIQHLALLEAVTRASIQDPDAFKEEVTALHTALTDRAGELGLYDKVEMEVSFYESDYFYKSMLGFLFSFVFLAISLVFLKSRWLHGLTWLGVLVSMGYLIAGITVRSVLLSRSPVATLYETILFSTVTGVLLAMGIEAFTRRRVALALGVVLGALGMLVSRSYEVSEAKDTMAPLVAVLRSNFWLTTHVITIIIGYGTCILAGLIGHVYLFGRLLGLARDDKAFYRSVARMVYGALCFGLFFSLVGTVLGGIWANDSWGRFWGWDPKENGALLIVLWCLFILHARQCGWLRDFGVCATAIAGNIVVSLSWWGVNLLNVGLHSYGFTEGISLILLIVCSLELLVIGLGSVGWLLHRERQSALAEARAAPPAPPAP